MKQLVFIIGLLGVMIVSSCTSRPVVAPTTCIYVGKLHREGNEILLITQGRQLSYTNEFKKVQHSATLTEDQVTSLTKLFTKDFFDAPSEFPRDEAIYDPTTIVIHYNFNGKVKAVECPSDSLPGHLQMMLSGIIDESVRIAEKANTAKK